MSYFPEIQRAQVDALKPSSYFLKGLKRRFFDAPKQKVFVIGLHKTGTTSLGKALQRLGYRVCGSHKTAYDYVNVEQDVRDYLMDRAEDHFKEFNAFQDTPWFLLYKNLYERFPNAKFILTLRDRESWLRSAQSHFKKHPFPFHDILYANHNPVEHPAIYREVFDTHNENVLDFFKDKGQLLSFRVGHDGYEALTDFLETSSINEPFPHANKKSSRNQWITKLKKRLKQIWYQ
ncbi:sulfotransferase family protein [Nonlabens xiamenensis]|uniref:sulfotransferase family protein n=1 Tax=Nonlabens xiamenensis TaxID=2341043 RepID=UPI000F60E422|nr:sulfotransferase family protein [Nonlabens xiamenensis]